MLNIMAEIKDENRKTPRIEHAGAWHIYKPQINTM
jgi:hypothetical protein